MSLLTSPLTTPEQYRFFHQLDKQYKKRSFLNTNFVESPNPLEHANGLALRFETQLKELMDAFMGDLKGLYEGARDSRIDYYFMLSEMKSYDFFHEAASIVNDNLAAQHQQLLRENGRLKETVRKAHQELRQLARAKPERSRKPSMNSKFNGVKSVAENLYEKAKTLDQQEFADLCNRVILQEKVVINKMADSEAYRHWGERRSDRGDQGDRGDRREERELMARVDGFLQKKGRANNQEDLESQLAGLIADFRQAHTQLGSSCQRPCCNAVEERRTMRSKASEVQGSSESRRESVVYKNDRSEEYFNRYYRKSEFDIHKVLNVERTKLEEMQRIEEDYRLSVKQRHRLNRSMVK